MRLWLTGPRDEFSFGAQSARVSNTDCGFEGNMQRPLSEHIVRLEEKIIILKKALRNTDLPYYERSEREIALQNAEEALRLFRKAYDLEQRISH